MTNHWVDIANSDVILVIGANPAENHPASFGHITDAIEKGGATLINVDPRFTRTSAKAHIYAPMRSGTDIAFIGAISKYVMEDMEANPGNYNMTYVREYTNAPYLLNPDFKGPAELDGVFSGLDTVARKYDKSTWTFQKDADGIPIRDMTMTDPNCVFQTLKRHWARYTPALASSVTGCPEAKIMEIAQTYAATGAPGKSGTIMYAMGTTQHTNGTQMIRSYAMLQLLLGNMGVTGGGINALRGESNVQGSTDHCILFHILPGYLKQPIDTDVDLAAHNLRATPTTNNPRSLNWWKNYPKYMASLLKAWYGDSATLGNDLGFNWLPKIDKGGNYSWIPLFKKMFEGDIKGLFVFGQNPAVCSPNAIQTRQAMAKLDWMVVAELWETETAAVWKRPGQDPSQSPVEVFLLPAACSYEKEGSVTNSGRWSQWRYKAVEPPGEAKHDLWIINQIMKRIQALYAAEGGPNSAAITNLTWDYGDDPDAREVAKEINGYDLTTGKLMNSFGGLKTDGTTTAGNWLYTNSYVEPEMEPDAPIPGNRASRRSLEDGPFNVGLTLKWAWCWPVNRRIIYNRCSVDLDGVPWDADKPVIKWDDVAKKWLGDVPDGGAPPQNQGGYNAFIMKPEGHAHIFGPGRADGPFPEHYEPWESPVDNLISGTQNDPTFTIWTGGLDVKGSRDQFPIVATTFRLVEHWQSGQMSRNLPWLVELMPEMYVEMSEELAAQKGIKSGDKVKVTSARASIEVAAMVTKRLRPLQVAGKSIHEVAMPWHWGYMGLSTGPSANELTPNAGDANTTIPEFKAFLVSVEKVSDGELPSTTDGRYEIIEPLVIQREEG